MRINRKILLAMAVFILAVGVASIWMFARAQQPPADPGTLDWYAEQAGVAGSGGWIFESGIFEYVEPSTWDEVLATQSLVVAELIESRSYPNHNNTGIFSWHRFRVLETLSQKDTSVCATCSTPTLLPADFAPPAANEIVLQKYSGSLAYNGFWLSSTESNFPEYIAGQKYLLILDLNPNDRSAAVRLGPLGVYRIDSSGLMTCICEDVGRENPYKDELTYSYGNSINQLRAALNSSPGPSPSPTPTPLACHPSNTLVRKCEDFGGSWDWELCSCN